MLQTSVPQKQMVLSFFDDDIKIVKKYFSSIDFDFNEEFRFDSFKGFIYSAAGMFKDIDISIYNKELIGKLKTIQYLSGCYDKFEEKSRYANEVYRQYFLKAQESYMAKKELFEELKITFQSLLPKEVVLTEKRAALELRLVESRNKISESDFDILVEELKKVKCDQVDTIHAIGVHRSEIEKIGAILKSFEELNKEEFLRYFEETKEKLTHQYTKSLDFFGFEFNKILFYNSERSNAIQRFKKEFNINGDLNLCKYVEYYLRNVSAELLSDAKHKERLFVAKRYCEKEKA